MKGEKQFDIAREVPGILNKHVLAALSGGADSVALVHMLNSLKKENKIALTCAHFEHGIRGEESRSDLQFVIDLCARLDIPLICESGDIPAEAESSREGLETCARRMRHAFLKRAMEACGADFIATAHHKGDQAETVLMHILRGGGISGACGMRMTENIYVRPLLNCSKEEIIKYLEDKGEAWREDKTNFISDNARNLLRLEALPVIEKAYPGAQDALVRFSEIAQAENDYMEQMTDDAFHSSVSYFPGVWIIKDAHLLPVAVSRRVIRRLSPDFTFSDIERIRKADAKFSLPFGYTCERIGDSIYLTHETKPPLPVPLSLEGTTCLPGICRLTACASDGAFSKKDVFTQTLNADALEGALLRTRMDTDFMRPLGMGGKKKLVSDILTDRKVPRPMRDHLPVIAKGSEVLWLVGHMISESAKIDTSSRPVKITAEIYTKDGGNTP